MTHTALPTVAYIAMHPLHQIGKVLPRHNDSALIELSQVWDSLTGVKDGAALATCMKLRATHSW